MSAPLELGETYQYRHTVTDAAGVPANAGTVTVSLTLPDGTTVTPTVINSGAGLYDFDYLASQAGRHVLIGTAAGGTLGSATEKFEDVFNVEEPGRLLVGFDEARTYLRDSLTITSRDDREQLRWLILAASDGVERALGRTLCRRTGLVEYFNGGQTDLNVPRQPLRWPDGYLTVTSVVEDGTTLVENTDFVVLRKPWRLHRGTKRTSLVWAAGYETVAVTYAAGCRVIPNVVRSMVLAEVQQKWQMSQQASHPLLDEGTDLESLTASVAASARTRIDDKAWFSLTSKAIG